MDNQIIVGLDIGTTKIACFIGKRGEDGNLVILGYGKTESDGVERGIVRNILTASNSVKKAIEIASNQADYDVTEVYVGIAGQHIKSSQCQTEIIVPTEHPYILQEDLDQLFEQQRKAVLPPGEKIIHIIPQTYSVDNSELGPTTTPVGVRGKRLKGNFHVVTCNEENCLNIISCVELAGFKVKNIVLEPIASAYAVLDQSEKEVGVALVDIGGGTTDIAIFLNNSIVHTSVIAMAGNKITDDIIQGCGIVKRQAENLKIKYGCCLHTMVNEDDIISIPATRYQVKREIRIQTLARIIGGCTDLLLPLVGAEIESTCKSPNQQMGIVLTGGGSMLRGIKEATEMRLGKPARIGTPDEHLDKTDSNLAKELSHPMFATGIGLVLYGIEEMEKMKSKEEPKETTVEVDDVPKPGGDIFGNMETEANTGTTDGSTDNNSDDPETGNNGEKPGNNNNSRKGFGQAISDFFTKLLSEDRYNESES